MKTLGLAKYLVGPTVVGIEKRIAAFAVRFFSINTKLRSYGVLGPHRSRTLYDHCGRVELASNRSCSNFAVMTPWSAVKSFNHDLAIFRPRLCHHCIFKPPIRGDILQMSDREVLDLLPSCCAHPTA